MKLKTTSREQEKGLSLTLSDMFILCSRVGERLSACAAVVDGSNISGRRQ